MTKLPVVLVVGEGIAKLCVAVKYNLEIARQRESDYTCNRNRTYSNSPSIFTRHQGRAGSRLKKSVHTQCRTVLNGANILRRYVEGRIEIGAPRVSMTAQIADEASLKHVLTSDIMATFRV